MKEEIGFSFNTDDDDGGTAGIHIATEGGAVTLTVSYEVGRAHTHATAMLYPSEVQQVIDALEKARKAVREE